MCNKAIRTYPSTIQFVTKIICCKPIDTFLFDFVPDRHMTQELCDKFVAEELFMLKYCPDRYKNLKKV